MAEHEANKALFKKHGSLWVRKAQRDLSSRGIIPTVENTESWISKQKAAKPKRGTAK